MVVVSSVHRTHGQWWQHVEAVTDDAGVLERLQSDVGVRRALVATLEASVEASIAAYHARGESQPLERWLSLNLGENLLDEVAEVETRVGTSASYRNTYSTYTYGTGYPGANPPGGFAGDGSGGVSQTGGGGRGVSPRRMLRAVVRDSHVAGVVDVDAVAGCLAAELKRRLTVRRPRLRERCVCVTWRGKHTNISTMSRAVVLDVTTALSVPDVDFDVVLNTVAPPPTPSPHVTTTNVTQTVASTP